MTEDSFSALHHQIIIVEFQCFLSLLHRNIPKQPFQLPLKIPFDSFWYPSLEQSGNFCGIVFPLCLIKIQLCHTSLCQLIVSSVPAPVLLIVSLQAFILLKPSEYRIQCGFGYLQNLPYILGDLIRMCRPPPWRQPPVQLHPAARRLY